MDGQLAARIQRVLESGDFETALPLIETYGAAVRQAIQIAASHEQIEIAGNASAFLSDRLHLARVMRAQLATQLSSVSRLNSYAEDTLRENSWFIEG